MKYEKRIDGVYEKALRLPLNETSKYVLMSDCHRSDGSGADQFLPNRNHFIVALERYFGDGFTYIELGDGDELWENKRMEPILDAQAPAFAAMRKFHEDGRLYMIYGNHDMVKNKAKWRTRNLYRFCPPHRRDSLSLFPGLPMHEGIVLTGDSNEILLLHGHQADFFNDRLWKLSRFLVRYLWRPLELIGIKNPTSAASGRHKKNKVEEALSAYCRKKQRMIVAGHTHRTSFPKPGEASYFNDGCCVYPHYATAMEIDGGKLKLAKWGTSARPDGTLYVEREVLEGPMSLAAFSSVCTAL